MLLVFPSIMNSVKKTQGSINEAGKKLLYSSVELYIDSKPNDYSLIEGNHYCISVQELLDNKKLESINLIQNLKKTDMIEVTVNSNQYHYQLNNNCSNYVYESADKSGANAPELSEGMIPIAYNGTSWFKADSRNPAGEYQWYDYQEGMWANVAFVSQNRKIKDLSGNGYDGIIRGATQKNIDGVLGLSFDGINDYIEVPYLPASIDWDGGFIVEFTATWESFNSYARIFDFGAAGGEDIFAVCTYRTTDKLNLHVHDQTGVTTYLHSSTNALPLHEKVKIKIIFQKITTGYQTDFYINDVLDSSHTLATSTQLIAKLQRIYNYIGKSAYDYDGYFKGYIYNFKISLASGTPVIWYDFTNNSNYIEPIDYKKASLGTIIPEQDIEAYFVWIPRYQYKIEGKYGVRGVDADHPGYITVTFTKKQKPDPGNIMPTAFEFGKFEMTGNASHPTVKPNLYALSNQNIATQFATCQQLNKGYGLSTTMDAHMLKSSEWGAVAYLTQSVYGRCQNGTCEEVTVNNINTDLTDRDGQTMTGCAASVSKEKMIRSTSCINSYQTEKGVKASSTGNIYGIYDMNGGGEDVSFTVYSNPDRNGIYAAYSGWSSEQNSGFNGYLAGEKIYKTDGVNFPSSKYFDIYTTIKLNDPSYYQSWALGETSGWYSDYSSVDYWTEYPVEEPEVFSPFQHRGGNYNNKYDGHSGIFYSHPHNGHAHPIASTRIVISSK